MKTLILVALACTFLSGCGAHVGKMEYSPSFWTDQDKVENKTPVYITALKDSREGGKRDPARIGRLVGGFGETLKSIEVAKPVGESVSNMLGDFMLKRGVNIIRTGPIPKDGLTLSGEVNSFFCAFYWVHNANININLVLTENATGRKLWESSIDEHFSGGNIFNQYTKLGSDPTIACLGYDCHARGISAAMNMMLSDGVTKLWEKSGLREALEGSR